MSMRPSELGRHCTSVQYPNHKDARAAFSRHPRRRCPRGALGVGDRASASWKERSHETQAVGSTHLPVDSQSYDALKLRFSATVGEEPEVEVVLL
jgi:hypothetical protein